MYELLLLDVYFTAIKRLLTPYAQATQKGWLDLLAQTFDCLNVHFSKAKTHTLDTCISDNDSEIARI